MQAREKRSELPQCLTLEKKIYHVRVSANFLSSAIKNQQHLQKKHRVGG
ncbi:hypothetical protein [Aquibacillus rhizosphaerae]|uniref:Uncharacterized protein n=1 Tax=Aquibacillus rhizosphaerae TaxID=3051431 RepID=A0ABT7LAF3_9BACI|nr:hypothetical protein [Aquibacillus sp. LR5S19]MDL4841525.1 hypothetical protein [Aquibacillus sp. LR5S19]